MKIEVIIYTITKGQRNSVDHAVNNIPEALKVIEKALKEGKCMDIKVK